MQVNHALVNTPYHIGMAIHWIVEIATDLAAVKSPHADGPPTPGSLCHYYTHGNNNDHVEFVLSTVEDDGQHWIADHAGGGRAMCGISKARSDVLWSAGRPLQHWYSWDEMVLKQG